MAIKVLEKHVAELIAAGEVVERPASVVKELVENAIDAGARTVTVELKNGGISYLRVTDNGCCIPADEVRTAFLRHATSKVATEEDLASIGTLGFRGEALASIAAVARIELLTAVAGKTGVSYKLEGGEEVSFEEAGCPTGTTMIVRDLFYNTPARMKFLKKDVTEANAIAGVVDRIALSHPEVSVRLVRDGKQTLQTPGDGQLKAAIYAVYGREFTGGLIPADYKMGEISVSGFVCAPLAARASRSMQHFFLNGRYVKSKTAMAALEQAFRNAIMVGKFPSCVLNIEMPYNMVDINVHPAKTEVRFAQEKPVFDAVYYAVKTALSAGDVRPSLQLGGAPASKKQAPPVQTKLPQTGRTLVDLPRTQARGAASPLAGSGASGYVPPSARVSADAPGTSLPPIPVGRDTSASDMVRGTAHVVYDSMASRVQQSSPADRALDILVDDEEPSHAPDGTAGRAAAPDGPLPADAGRHAEEDPGVPESSAASVRGEAAPELAQVNPTTRVPAPPISTHTAFPAGEAPGFSGGMEGETIASAAGRDAALFPSDADAPQSGHLPGGTADDAPQIAILGEAFETYILAQCGEDLIFIDKHAAHERMLFEKLRREEIPSQLLLEPVPVTLAKEEAAALLENAGLVQKAGFEVEDFGGSAVLVRAVPAPLAEQSPAEMITEIAGGFAEQKGAVTLARLDWLYHNIACRAAIKAGAKSTEPELMLLARRIVESGEIKYCPHGRPVAFVLTRRELEKQFGRTT